MKVTCGESTPSVPPEKMVMASEGMSGVHACAARVREKSFTQPLPVRRNRSVSAQFIRWPKAH